MRMMSQWIMVVLLIVLSTLTYAKQPILAIQQWQTPIGAEVYFVPAPDLPMIDIQVAFAAGSSRDVKQAGLAHLTATMLEQGSADLSATQIARQFADIGAHFSVDVDRDMAVVSLRSLTDSQQLSKAIQLFNQVLTQPSFPAKDFDREQAASLQALQAQQQSPARLAANAFYQQLYGEQPYAHPVWGIAESLQSLTRTQVQEFYRQYYVSNNAVVTIVGAVSRQQAEQLSQQILATLPAGQRAVKQDDAHPLSATQTVTHIQHPSTQTHVYIGSLGIKPSDDDYFALFTGNHILGGGALTSRLYQQVRDQRGLSYSVYSYFLSLANKGPFILTLQTRNAQTQEAITVARQVLHDFIEQGPTEEELQAAKQNIIGALPLSVASNAAISRRLLRIAFYHLPLNYVDIVAEKVQALTVTQIKQAFQRKLGQQSLVMVTVGQNAEG